MAGNLIRGLNRVPWNEVIRNAPVVANVAKELWGSIHQQPQQPTTTPNAPPAQPSHSPEAQDVARLQAQLTAVEIAAADLHGQMLKSSEIIAVLADQNTQLIKRIEANRVRTLWLTRATVVVGIVAVFDLVLILVR